MKFTQINEWFTLIANIGVVLGIVFLAIEVRQNTEQLESDARTNRTGEVIGLQLFLAENSDMLGNDECSPQVNLWTSALFELQMWQFLETGMPDYLVARYQDYTLSVPCIKDWWEETMHRYDPQFVAFMEDNVYN